MGSLLLGILACFKGKDQGNAKEILGSPPPPQEIRTDLSKGYLILDSLCGGRRYDDAAAVERSRTIQF